MRKSRFTESQIVAILKEGEAGVPVAELTRNHGISRGTYFNWRSKYGGVSVNELKRMKELEAENAKLKRMYADLALENAAIKDENCNAVREAPSRRAVRGGASASHPASLSHRGTVSDGVLSSPKVERGARFRGDCCARGHGGKAPALGLLEVLRPPADRRSPMESQAGPSRVLCPATQSPSASQTPRPPPASPAARGSEWD